jgi:flagellar motility protein MotE (MotC chaperone)
MLIVVAFLALTLRGINIYTGFELLDQQAVAQDVAEEDAGAGGETAEADATEAAAQTAEPALQDGPLVIGLPSTEEMELITQLRERREALEGRERQLDLQEQLLASTEKRINDKIKQLEVLEVRIKEHLRLFEDAEEKQLDSIVKVYETMKPKDAAPRFEALALQTQVDLVTRMKASKVAALMGEMTPQKASILTTELATQVQPPSIEEVQRGGR